MPREASSARETGSPVALHDRALDNLTFIRRTMERSGTFTAVSGWGGIGMGVIALGAAALAPRQATAVGWLAIWLLAALGGGAVAGAATIRKARSVDERAWSGPGRRFVLNFCPAMLAGGVLTVVLWQAGLQPLLPGVWLLLYGTGVVTGGAFSVRVVPAMGVTFMILGILALAFPDRGDLFMAGGFGGAHIAFGAIIAGKYGG